ncbi:hypothetical protein PC123_g17517 [Phytophthora cactorum]|nr:hypothetical protein PC120_g3991 [Phytophthora cactorum]KAG4047121.1 hypothetical protein PC123_g17517 [Phytophthora cactorum]
MVNFLLSQVSGKDREYGPSTSRLSDFLTLVVPQSDLCLAFELPKDEPRARKDFFALW